MKVYVDELPKSCDNCKFQVFIAHHQSGFLHRERYCPLRIDSDYKCSKENCPLQSLADYTKQVRKEVCDKIYKALTSESGWHRMKNWYSVNDECDELREFLDQIQGETKC